ncbi:MAG TPA: DegT/DnrJ/EryC1/StrS family aminotransferase [Myxococcota bacterium]|nr:DegT/DnrJ/EryC1/StrS family aminotransferase [Myxococcota bacterium]
MSPRIPIVDVPAEYGEIGAEIEAAVLRVLRSGRYVLGPETEAFERELAGFVGTRHAVGVGSGTEALCLALRACGVGPGDEVITTSLSFFATAEAILWTGATPVYVDVERGGFHMDPAGLEAARSPRTRAIVPVHLFGRCADMTRIRGFADRFGLPVIEDAAQAIGAVRAGRRAGAGGRAGCFSFYPSKALGAAGDGGAICTDDDALAASLRSLRHHGAGPTGHERVGTTSRLDSLQAAVLRAKLPHLPRWLAQRAAHVARYRALLARAKDVRMPGAGADETPAWSQFVIRSEKAEGIRRALDQADIEWRHHYPRPLYCEPAFGAGRLCPGTCPEAERACAESISIPLHPQLSPASIERVCEVILEAVGA